MRTRAMDDDEDDEGWIPKKQKIENENPEPTTTALLASALMVVDPTTSSTKVKKEKKHREFNWSNALFGQFLLKIAYLGTRYSVGLYRVFYSTFLAYKYDEFNDVFISLLHEER